ncbi:MAG: type ISP restriction/modification enzyme [Promethearchaeota archaeon]
MVKVIRSFKELAGIMGQLAIQLREQIKHVLRMEVKNGPLHKLFKNFEKFLIINLKPDEFADMYAQTIVYGLFSAIVGYEGTIRIDNVTSLIPNTNPFLKNLFNESIKFGEENIGKIDPVESVVKELITLLKESDLKAILRNFEKKKKGKDPVTHFYELFLQEFDVSQKSKMGVFYTPDSVVSFMVRSVDNIIQNDFGYPDGLMDISKSHRRDEHKKDKYHIRILDPATGTGTFLQHVIREIKKRFDTKYKNLGKRDLNKKWNNYVPNSLLPRIFGFEIMMAPYAVAHLKLGLTLRETGYNFKSDKRLGIYLINALEGTEKGPDRVEPLDVRFNWLTEEVINANNVKTNGVSIIIGNPPYSKFTQNKNRWIRGLINTYRYVDEERIKDKKSWLLDDYIKFLRFGQWILRNKKNGILAYITNNGFLDAPTLRGMRQSLLNEFNKIYIINLHGDSKKHEIVPKGLKNENIFDIQQGVSINIFVKTKVLGDIHEIYYHDVWGDRESKYYLLEELDISKIPFKKVTPTSPFYIFIPQDTKYSDEYFKYWSIKDIFIKYTSGIVTAQDSFVIDISKKVLLNKIQDLDNHLIPIDKILEKYDLPERYKDKLERARKNLKLNHNLEFYIRSILYRPFDERFIFYNPSNVWRMREEVILNMEMESPRNLAILTTRNITALNFNHVFLTDKMTEMKTCSHDRNSYIFPLYYYDFPKNTDCYDQVIDSKFQKQLNITKDFIVSIKENTNLKFSKAESDFKSYYKGEDIVYYILAILNSQSYRIRYKEFLKPDFPRIPIPSSKNLFQKLSQIGKELKSIYLMNFDFPLIEKEGNFKFESEETLKIASGYPKYTNNRIYFNENQYFSNITRNIWNFKIGGYQICKKWLRFYRKKKSIKGKDIFLYQKIIVALSKLINLMEKIDKIIESNDGWPIN